MGQRRVMDPVGSELPRNRAGRVGTVRFLDGRDWGGKQGGALEPFPMK